MITSVRIEVPQDIYDALHLEQEIRRQASGKKTAMAVIILEYCSSWMNHKGNAPADSTIGSAVSPNNNQQSPATTQASLNDLLQLEKKLKEREENIQKAERYNNQRQNELNEAFLELNDKQSEVLDQKEQAIEKKEQAKQISLDCTHDKWVIEKLTADNAAKDSTIQHQKTEIENLKNNVIKSLQKIENNTKSNIFMDYIVPLLPSIIPIVLFFITNKKIAEIAELNPIQTELKHIYNKISAEDENKLNGILRTTIDQNVKVKDSVPSKT
jgi:DNA repair exonuclease SbcCD ATPase subunit